MAQMEMACHSQRPRLGSRAPRPEKRLQHALHTASALDTGRHLGGYILCLFVPQILNDGDTYMHIAAGNWIIQHRAVPSVDPFSYRLPGGAPGGA